MLKVDLLEKSVTTVSLWSVWSEISGYNHPKFVSNLGFRSHIPTSVFLTFWRKIQCQIWKFCESGVCQPMKNRNISKCYLIWRDLLREKKVVQCQQMSYVSVTTKAWLVMCDRKLRCVVASCDVRVRTHFIKTSMRACSVFLGLLCAISTSHTFQQ